MSADPWGWPRRALLFAPLVATIAAGAAYMAWQFEPAPAHVADVNVEGDGPQQPGGRLVVVAVFDQMAGEYLTRFAPAFDGAGFERMKREGAWFSATLPYGNSSTGPGHASIATGVPPSVHGIIENDWYDRARGRRVHCVLSERPYASVPASAVPDLAARPGAIAPTTLPTGGLSPDRLLVPTLGDRLKAQGGRVYSLGLKARSAVLMGGHKPDACYAFSTSTGEFHTSAYYRERPHDWVSQFNAGGPDRWHGKPWERLLGAPLYDRLVGPDAGPGEVPNLFPHAIGPPTQSPGGKYYAALEGTPFANDMLWSLAKSAIEADGLGTRGTADLLWLGLSANDALGHAHGPHSHEALDATARSDRLVADMLRTLDERVGPGRYTLIVTADHGICPLPERPGAAPPDPPRFNPSELVAPLNAVLAERFGPAPGGPWLEQLDYPWLYFNARAVAARGVSEELLHEAAAQWCANRLDWCHAAYPRRRLAGPPAADPLERAVQLSYRPDRSGDVCLVHTPYALPMGRASAGTTHGSPHAYDRDVPILALGRGVPKLGRVEGAVSSLALAPIAAKALGVALEGAVEKLPQGFP